LRCSSQRGGFLGFAEAGALERPPPPFLDGGGAAAEEEEAGEISLKMPPNVWARVRT
jgi:hypothetical protein